MKERLSIWTLSSKNEAWDNVDNDHFNNMGIVETHFGYTSCCLDSIFSLSLVFAWCVDRMNNLVWDVLNKWIYCKITFSCRTTNRNILKHYCSPDDKLALYTVFVWSIIKAIILSPESLLQRWQQLRWRKDWGTVRPRLHAGRIHWLHYRGCWK